MGVPFSAGECFCGELDPWKLSKTWTKAFSFYFLFFFFNLSRLCWEQVLWLNSALSCGHCIRGREVFFL